tara:strand:- start:1504 stop:1662 length:159 start_codon:yes stop_codon:yes gene_type:complete
MKEIKSNKNRGLVAGYEPNPLSFYIILLHSDRLEELNDVLWKHMEKYKIKED